MDSAASGTWWNKLIAPGLASARPGWDAFGLTVTADAHTVWFDRPGSDHTWQLAPR